MTSFLSRMPNGIAGDVSRQQGSTIESVQVDPNTPPTAYGQFCKLVSGKLQPIASGDAASVIYGILVRPFPFSNQSVSQGLGAGTPPTTGIVDVLRRGYMTVVNKQGTPAKGGIVYVRITADTGKAVADIEAAGVDSGKCVAVPATFQSAADANGNVEIAYNI